MKLRWMRTAAAYLASGAIVLQIGTCMNVYGPVAVAATNFGTLLSGFGFCGVTNVRTVDSDGRVVDLANSEDDLIFGCPVIQVEEEAP